MKLNALAKAITLATVLSATSFGALAADIPLSATVEADQVTTKVISVDAANHQVVLEGAEGKPFRAKPAGAGKPAGARPAKPRADAKDTSKRFVPPKGPKR
mgnify:CR=1 FL=1